MQRINGKININERILILHPVKQTTIQLQAMERVKNSAIESLLRGLPTNRSTNSNQKRRFEKQNLRKNRKIDFSEGHNFLCKKSCRNDNA